MFCPFEDRYGSPEMRNLFSEERRIETMLEVIKSELMALIEVGILGEEAKPIIRSLSLEGIGGIERIKTLEKEFDHELLALINAVAESLGEYGSAVALGLSSPDIIDTASSIIIRKALAIIEEKLVKVIRALLSLGEKYHSTLFLSRTHLWPALPITLEFLFVNYAYRLSHVLNLLEKFRRWRCYGKLSGPTGGYPALGKFQSELERKSLRKLGLRPVDISFQWLPREYLAELIFFLSLLCADLAKIASDLWDLSRPEIGLFSFPENPSSSSMPHKHNPLRLERIIGIFKSISPLLLTSLECVQERCQGDSTKSSAERFLVPHAFMMADQALEDMMWVLENLKVEEGRIKEEISKKGTLYLFSYNLLKELCLKGMNRKEAFEIVFSYTIRSKSMEELKEAVKKDQTIRRFLREEDIEGCCETSPLLDGAEIAIERAKKRIKIILDSLAL